MRCVTVAESVGVSVSGDDAREGSLESLGSITILRVPTTNSPAVPRRVRTATIATSMAVGAAAAVEPTQSGVSRSTGLGSQSIGSSGLRRCGGAARAVAM